MPPALERALLIVLLALPAVPFARIAGNRGFRRKLRAYPRTGALLGGGLGGYAILLVALALRAPIGLLRGLAVVAIAGLAIEAWRSRSGHGGRRGLPPGSLAWAPLGPWRNPEHLARLAGRWGPVFKYRNFVYPTVAVVGLERGVDLLRSHADALRTPPLPFDGLVPGGFLRYLEGPRHRATSSILRGAISPEIVAANEAAIVAEARSSVAALVATGSVGARPRPILDRMVLHALGRIFYGLPPGSDLDRLDELYRVADHRRLAAVGSRAARAALDEIVDRLRARVQAQGAGLASALGRMDASHPETAGDEHLLGNLATAFHLARTDVANLLVWVVKLVGENPAALGRVAEDSAADPARARAPGGAAERIVLETLRLWQSEYVMRRATREVRWNGTTIPAGWHVRICVRESHRSPDAFAEPDRFDPDRFLDAPGRDRYAPFGVYRQLCLGEGLTRAVGRLLVAELAAWQVDIVADGPPQFGGFHWRPHDRFRVALSARAA